MDDLEYVQSPPQLAGIQARTAELNVPWASETRTGALLRVLAASKPGGRLLELGTGTGLSTTWLLAGMDANSMLVTVEADAKLQEIAREALGADPRLAFVVDDAANYIRGLPPLGFDLLFAGATAGKYEALDEALALVKPGGYYVIDDMLPQPNWPDGLVEKVPALMARLAANECFDLVPMVWASGVVVAVRKPDSTLPPAES